MLQSAKRLWCRRVAGSLQLTRNSSAAEVNNHDKLISSETPSLTENPKTPPEATSEEQHNLLERCMTRLQQNASCLDSLLIDFG